MRPDITLHVTIGTRKKKPVWLREYVRRWINCDLRRRCVTMWQAEHDKLAMVNEVVHRLLIKCKD
jgi:hypothetical protein